MLVKELIEILSSLDENAVIDMASDEEGNNFGDIDQGVAEGELLTGEKVYTLYPLNCEMCQDRYF